MARQKNAGPTDLDLLNRMKPVSFFQPSRCSLREPCDWRQLGNFRRLEVFPSAGVHILIRDAAKITCLKPV